MQGRSAANLRGLASAFSGSSSKPEQAEPPNRSAARPTLHGARGDRGESRVLRFPPAALRRFRRAKAAPKQQAGATCKTTAHPAKRGQHSLPRKTKGRPETRATFAYSSSGTSTCSMRAMRLGTILPSSMVRRTPSPRAMRPASSSSERPSSTVRWISRRKGRAPNFGS